MTWYKNPYLAVLFVPLLSFIALVVVGVSPDPINLCARMFVFALFGYVGARYVGRAPLLMWQGNTAPEARNIIGWALLIVGSMLSQMYGALYIWYDRPEWLSSQYWSPSFVVLIGTGLTLVASSIPKFPPFGQGPQGLSVFGSFVVGFASAMGLFFASHVPQLITMLKAMWLGVVQAV